MSQTTERTQKDTQPSESNSTRLSGAFVSQRASSLQLKQQQLIFAHSQQEPTQNPARSMTVPAFSDRRASTQVQLQQQGMMYEKSKGIIQRVPSYSHVQYTPSPADMVLINALDAQVAACEIAARNDVQNNPAPLIHTQHQAAYMRRPSAAGWGNCVEEKLNPWAVANGWSTQNNSSGSNPDYSQMNAGTKIWADLTTAAEAGGGGAHIGDKLMRKASAGEDDSTWVASDIVHQGLNPLAGQPPQAVATNGIVSPQQLTAWQTYEVFKGGYIYDDLMNRRVNELRDIRRIPSSFAVYTQIWSRAKRETFRMWIDGTNDGQLPDDSYSDDEYAKPPPTKKVRR